MKFALLAALGLSTASAYDCKWTSLQFSNKDCAPADKGKMYKYTLPIGTCKSAYKPDQYANDAATTADAANTNTAVALNYNVHWCHPAVSTATGATNIAGLLFYTTYSDATCATVDVQTETSDANKEDAKGNVVRMIGNVATATDKVRGNVGYCLNFKEAGGAPTKSSAITALSNTVGGAQTIFPPTSTATFPMPTVMTNAMKNFVCANQMFGMCNSCAGATCTAKAAA